MQNDSPQMPPQPPALPESDKATTVFVLGLIGLLMCQPLGIMAWIMGRAEQQKVDAGRVAPNDLLKVGTILGIVATILFGVQVLMFMVWLGFIVLAIGAGAAGAAAGGLLLL